MLSAVPATPVTVSTAVVGGVLALAEQGGDFGFFVTRAATVLTAAAIGGGWMWGAGRPWGWMRRSLGLGGALLLAYGAEEATIYLGHAWLREESACSDARAVEALAAGTEPGASCMWFGTSAYYQDGRADGARCLAWTGDHGETRIRCVDAAGALMPVVGWDND